jgi:hypothetical protein
MMLCHSVPVASVAIVALNGFILAKKGNIAASWAKTK